MSKVGLAALLVGCSTWCLGAEVRNGPVCAGRRLLAKGTAELSLSVGMYELAAPGQILFYPVLVECDRDGRSSLPAERTRALAREPFTLAYLTADEIRACAGQAGVVCLGSGGEPLKSAAAARAHLWPQDVKRVQPAAPVHVVLALVDINSRALTTLDEEFARRIVFQCTSAKDGATPEAPGIPSVHGAQMADVCRKFAPDVHFALYDGNLEKADIVMGLDTIHEYAHALGAAAVVNLSASCQAGSHDGRSLWERALGSYAAQDYFIVTSSGNTLGRDVHLVITDSALADDNSVEIPLTLERGPCPAQFELGLWFRGDSPTSYQIVGLTDEAIAVGPDFQFCYLAPTLTVLTASQATPEKGGDANVTLAVHCTAAPTSPRCIVRLFFARRVAGAMRCDGWISSTPAGWISCRPYATPQGTINSFSCAPGIVSVGTMRHAEGKRVFQGLGPTRDGRVKPDMFVQTEASTSYAAAIVSGLLAQRMETRGMQDPHQMLTGLAGQYKWLVLPEAVYGGPEGIR